MKRPGMIVCLMALGLAFGCQVAGCGAPGKSLELINNTSVTVTMQSCPGNAPQTQQCSAAVEVAPGGSADFPLSGPSAGMRLVAITGYDGRPRCLIVPTTNLRESATADVTQANPAECTGQLSSHP